MLRRRVEAVRRELAMRRLDALLVTELTNVRYLTGFTGSNGCCLLTPRRTVFFTDSRYKSQAPQEVTHAFVVIARGGLFTSLAERKLLRPGARIGFEAEHLSVASFRTLKRLHPKSRFLPETSIVERISSVKDDGELRLIRRAVEITDAVFAKILGIVRPGVRESEVAAEISYWHRLLGADADAFDPIVASGVRGAFPHAKASEQVIRNREMVTIDFGCRYGGYNSDLTRTLAVGTPRRELMKIYRTVQDAQRMAIDAARSGMLARELDAVARRHINRCGYGKYFVHSLGHGLGIHVHDPLRLSALSRDVLQRNNVVTIEPGIYVPGVGGVRIEDDVIIETDGCTVLNRAPRDLIVV